MTQEQPNQQIEKMAIKMIKKGKTKRRANKQSTPEELKENISSDGKTNLKLQIVKFKCWKTTMRMANL